MRTFRKTDFRKLKITLVTVTYHSQRPQCPSLSPHVLLSVLVAVPIQVPVSVRATMSTSSRTSTHIITCGSLSTSTSTNPIPIPLPVMVPPPLLNVRIVPVSESGPHDCQYRWQWRCYFQLILINLRLKRDTISSWP